MNKKKKKERLTDVWQRCGSILKFYVENQPKKEAVM